VTKAQQCFQVKLKNLSIFQFEIITEIQIDKGMNTVDAEFEKMKENDVEFKDDRNSLKSGFSQNKKFSVDSATTGLDDIRTKAFDESWFVGTLNYP